MENTNKKVFEASIDGHKYSVKRCVKMKTKDGKEYFHPVENEELVNCFVREDGKVIGEVVKDGGSWFKQLLLLLASLIDNKKEKTNK